MNSPLYYCNIASKFGKEPQVDERKSDTGRLERNSGGFHFKSGGLFFYAMVLHPYKACGISCKPEVHLQSPFKHIWTGFIGTEQCSVPIIYKSYLSIRKLLAYFNNY